MNFWNLGLNFACYLVVEFCNSCFLRPGEWSNEDVLPSPVVAFYSGKQTVFGRMLPLP